MLSGDVLEERAHSAIEAMQAGNVKRLILVFSLGITATMSCSIAGSKGSSRTRYAGKSLLQEPPDLPMMGMGGRHSATWH
ncbi:hypothetical protein UB43_01305 [Pseudomonas sp. 21]|nr:hypothetical protein UB43_01305 [Pseudomonas sp. 21]